MAEDEVVRQVDVYFSKKLAKALYLFQYPTRPCFRTFGDEEHIECKVKPQQQKVELHLPVDTKNHNYHVSKGEQIALNVDGRGAIESKYFGSNLMDKQVLTSGKCESSTSRCVCGFLYQGELHITPLNCILQFRPSFSYLDKSDALAKLENSTGTEDNELDEEKQATAVIPRFAGPDTERARLAKERSYNYLQQQSANEPWINVKYHSRTSHRSCMDVKRLLCSQGNREFNNASTSAKDYLNTLVPSTLLSSGAQHVNEDLQSVASIKTLPLVDQIRILLINAKVLKFSHLVDLFPRGTDTTGLERLLQQIAVLVQGCWVVKSDLLYAKDTISRLTGIGTDLLGNARDYVMWCYTKSRCITRREIVSVVKIPEEDVTEIVSQLGRKVRSKGGWEFKYPYDQEFVDNHPGVVQRQQMLWDARYNQLVKEHRIGQMESPKGSSSNQMNFPSPPRPRYRRQFKYLRDSVSDDAESSASEGGSVERMDVEYSKTKKSPKSPKRTSPYAIDDGMRKRNGPKSRTKSHMATFEISPTITNVIPASLELELTNYVREKFKKNFCMTISDVRESLFTRHSNLNRIISNELLQEIIAATGAQKVKNKWPQNTIPELLFAFTRFDSKFDRYREALLDLFSNTARSRPNLLVKKIEDDYGEAVSENDCRQIFEEYCILKSGFYYLKGTINADS